MRPATATASSSTATGEHRHSTERVRKLRRSWEEEARGRTRYR